MYALEVQDAIWVSFERDGPLCGMREFSHGVADVTHGLLPHVERTDSLASVARILYGSTWPRV